MTGRYTGEGDVRDLLIKSDDMFVIARPGDEIALAFDANGLPPLRLNGLAPSCSTQMVSAKRWISIPQVLTRLVPCPGVWILAHTMKFFAEGASGVFRRALHIST